MMPLRPLDAMTALPSHPFRIRYGPGDDLLTELYLPVLERSVRYDRLVGLASGDALARAAAGLDRLIRRGGSGRWLCGVRLTDEDVGRIDGGEAIDVVAAAALVRDLDDGDAIVRGRLAAVAWMLDHRHLDVRVALPLDEDGRALAERDARGSAVTFLLTRPARRSGPPFRLVGALRCARRRRRASARGTLLQDPDAFLRREDRDRRLLEAAQVPRDDRLGVHLPRGFMDDRVLEVREVELQRHFENGLMDRGDGTESQQLADLSAGLSRTDRLGRQIVDRGDRGRAQIPLHRSALHFGEKPCRSSRPGLPIEEQIEDDVGVDESSQRYLSSRCRR
jgi:hypothetical protein